MGSMTTLEPPRPRCKQADRGSLPSHSPPRPWHNAQLRDPRDPDMSADSAGGVDLDVKCVGGFHCGSSWFRCFSLSLAIFIVGAAVFATVKWQVGTWSCAVSVRDTRVLTLSDLWWVLSGVVIWKGGCTHLGTDFSSLCRGRWVATLCHFRRFRGFPRSCLSGSHPAGFPVVSGL